MVFAEDLVCLMVLFIGVALKGQISSTNKLLFLHACLLACLFSSFYACLQSKCLHFYLFHYFDRALETCEQIHNELRMCRRTSFIGMCQDESTKFWDCMSAAMVSLYNVMHAEVYRT